MRNIIPILLLFAGLAASAYGIIILPIWHDEAITLLQLAGNTSPDWPRSATSVAEYQALFSGGASFAQMTDMLINTDVHPPLYYYAAMVWRDLFGGETASIRALSLLCVAAAAILIIRMIPSKEVVARGGATTLLMLSPTVTFAAINARGYGLAILLVAVALYAAQKALSEDQAGKHVGILVLVAAASSALAFNTHYFTSFVCFPAVVVMAAYTARRNIAAHMGALLIGAIGLAAAVPFLRVQFTAREAQYAGFEGLLHSLQSALVNFSGQFTVAIKQGSETPWILVYLGVPVMLAASTMLLKKYRDRCVVLHLMVLTGFTVSLLALFWKTDKSVIEAGSRYFLFAFPSLVILISRGWQRLCTDFWAVGKLAFVISFTMALLLGATPRIHHIGPIVAPWPLLTDKANRSALLDRFGTQDAVVIMSTRARGKVGEDVDALPADLAIIPVQSPKQVAEAFDDAVGKSLVIVVQHGRSPVVTEVVEAIHKLEEEGYKRATYTTWVRQDLLPSK